MTIQRLSLLVAIFSNFLRAEGGASLTCLNLTDIHSEGNDWDLCVHVSLENGYCSVNGSYGCNSPRNNEAQFGCQDAPTAPSVSHEPEGSLDGYALGKNITLICNTDIETVTSYVWYSSGQEIPGENSKTMTVSEDITIFSNIQRYFYTCQYIFDQRASLISEAYTTAVLRAEGTFWTVTPSPALIGVPDDVFDGMLLELMCINFPLDGFYVEWYFNNVQFATTVNNNVYNGILINSTIAGGNLRCTFTFDNFQLNSPRSADALIPNLPESVSLPGLSISLEGNHFNLGDSVEMSCDFSDSAYTERALSLLPLTVVWYVNGTVQPAYTTMKIEVSPLDPAVHHGSWSCSVQLGSSDSKHNSSTVFMYVDGSLEMQMSTVPELPIMEGTLFIRCQYDYLYIDVASSVEFKWTFNNTVLYGYNTDFLYISFMDQHLAGVYTCTVSITNGRNATHSLHVGNPVSFEGIPPPSLRALGFEPGEDLIFGPGHQLQCVYDVRYATFGISITVFKDGEMIYPEGPEEDTCTDATSYDGIFNISLNHDMQEHNYTCRVEFGDKLSGHSNALKLSFSVFHSVVTFDEHSDQVTSIHRFFSDFLFLRCEASLLPNITGQVSYTWYDAEGDVSVEDSVLTGVVNGFQTTTFTCEARIESHRERVNVTVSAHENEAPNLSIVGRPEDGWLIFHETYDLFCDTGFIISVPGMQIEFSKDDVVVYRGNLPRYTISNDVKNHSYSCRAVGVRNTPYSNTVIASFRTIERVEIQTSDGEVAPPVITADINATIHLICNHTRSRGVPENANVTYNWYDLDEASYGNSPEIEVKVTPGFKTTFKCLVEVGDYMAISTNNVRFQCSGCFCSFWQSRKKRNP